MNKLLNALSKTTHNLSKKGQKFDAFGKRVETVCPLLQFIHSQTGYKKTQFGSVADEPYSEFQNDEYLRGYAA